PTTSSSAGSGRIAPTASSPNLHYMEPHHPYTPPPHLRPPAPPGIRPRVAAGRLDPWQAAMRAPVPFQLPAPELEHVRRLYEAEIRAWDEQLAALLRASRRALDGGRGDGRSRRGVPGARAPAVRLSPLRRAAARAARHRGS